LASPFRWRRRQRHASDSGFTLIEIAITILIASIVIVPLVDVMYGALSAGATDQTVANANAEATQQLEHVHAVPYADLGFYTDQSEYVTSWGPDNNTTVTLGQAAPASPYVVPVKTTTADHVTFTIETFITWASAAVPTATTGSPVPTITDANAYKAITVLVCWVPKAPNTALSSCTTSSTSITNVQAGQSTVEQQSLIYPGGLGPYSGTTTTAPAATTTTAPTTPNAPTNVTASVPSTGGDSEVNVTWSPPSSGTTPTGYLVQWSADPAFSTYSSSGLITAPTTSDLVTGLSPSTEYYFQVFSYDGLWSQSSPSAQASTTSSSSSNPPCTPVSFTMAPSWLSPFTTKVYLTQNNQLPSPSDLYLTANLTGACTSALTAVITSAPSPQDPELGWSFPLSNISGGYSWEGSASAQSWDAGEYTFSVYENSQVLSPPVSYNLLVCAYTATESTSSSQC
jgi:prepilin-type N-terminal cleavage/methylation domain-containing protein